MVIFLSSSSIISWLKETSESQLMALTKIISCFLVEFANKKKINAETANLMLQIVSDNSGENDLS